MNLTGGRLFWPTTVPTRAPPAPGVERELRCDALVVGCGISGALAARELTLAGVKVVAVDRHDTASGSTAASTALVMYEIDTPLLRLRQLIGGERADAAYRAAHEGVESIGRLCGDLGPGVEVAARQSLFLVASSEEADRLAREADARTGLGIVARVLDRGALLARHGIDRPAAIESTTARQVNPVQLTRAALADAVRLGAIVLERVTLDLSPLASRRAPYTLRGTNVRFTADWVIIAGGYEVPEQCAPIASLVELKSTYAIATERGPPPPWGTALAGGDGDPYFYCRSTADGRMIAGGADVPCAEPRCRDALIAERTGVVSRWLGRLAGRESVNVGFRWSGTFAETADGLPYLGPHRRWPNVLFSLGFGGNGITFAVVAAVRNAAVVQGRPRPTLDPFSFDRPGPASDESARP